MAEKHAQRAIIDQALVTSGEKERLKQLLRTKLIECGWRDEVKGLVKETIEKRGLEKVSVEELLIEITPKGRESVRTDVLNRIKKFMAEQNV